jgi:hypothetical protein
LEELFKMAEHTEPACTNDSWNIGMSINTRLPVVPEGTGVVGGLKKSTLPVCELASTRLP